MDVTKCPVCGGTYFHIVHKLMDPGCEMLPNSGRLQCMNCNQLFENLDGRLVVKNDR